MSESRISSEPMRGGVVVDLLQVVAFLYIVGSIIGALVIFLEYGVRDAYSTFGSTTELYLPAAIAAAGVLVQGLAVGLLLWVVGRMAESLWDIRQATRALALRTGESDE